MSAPNPNSIQTFTTTHIMVGGNIYPKEGLTVKFSQDGTRVSLASYDEILWNTVVITAVYNGNASANFANKADLQTYLQTHLTEATA